LSKTVCIRVITARSVFAKLRRSMAKENQGGSFPLHISTWSKVSPRIVGILV
jgi:hypothetical protein